MRRRYSAARHAGTRRTGATFCDSTSFASMGRICRRRCGSFGGGLCRREEGGFGHVRDRYPLPLISQLRDQLAGVRYFTRLDLPTAYADIRIEEGDEWKASRTRHSHFESCAMPFGLTNAPVTYPPGEINRNHSTRPPASPWYLTTEALAVLSEREEGFSVSGILAFFPSVEMASGKEGGVWVCSVWCVSGLAVGARENGRLV